MTDEVLFDRRGFAGIVTLNRPKALNALTLDMVMAMRAKLAEWVADPAVAIVVLRGEGERAFCAGGDIRAAALSGKADKRYALDFWREEYILNSTIKHYPKPYLSLTHGIVMGGGVGVSVHGTYRIADETSLFAMPETGIGFFPDVGGSYFLPRLPGEIGMYLALTGARLKAADMLYAGIATHFAAREQWPDLIDALARGQAADAVPMSDFCGTPEAAPLAAHRETIDRLFSGQSVEDILAGLDSDTSTFARETAAAIRSKSPTSLRLTFRQMRAGRSLDFDACMKMEYRMASRILDGYDFYEGVRAAVIDKDQSPRWRPATLGEVTDADIDAYFASLGENELPL